MIVKIINGNNNIFSFKGFVLNKNYENNDFEVNIVFSRNHIEFSLNIFYFAKYYKFNKKNKHFIHCESKKCFTKYDRFLRKNKFSNRYISFYTRFKFMDIDNYLNNEKVALENKFNIY